MADNKNRNPFSEFFRESFLGLYELAKDAFAFVTVAIEYLLRGDKYPRPNIQTQKNNPAPQQDKPKDGREDKDEKKKDKPVDKNEPNKDAPNKDGKGNNEHGKTDRAKEMSKMLNETVLRGSDFRASVTEEAGKEGETLYRIDFIHRQDSEQNFSCSYDCTLNLAMDDDALHIMPSDFDSTKLNAAVHSFLSKDDITEILPKESEIYVAMHQMMERAKAVGSGEFMCGNLMMSVTQKKEDEFDFRIVDFNDINEPVTTMSLGTEKKILSEDAIRTMTQLIATRMISECATFSSQYPEVEMAPIPEDILKTACFDVLHNDEQIAMFIQDTVLKDTSYEVSVKADDTPLKKGFDKPDYVVTITDKESNFREEFTIDKDMVSGASSELGMEITAATYYYLSVVGRKNIEDGQIVNPMLYPTVDTIMDFPIDMQFARSDTAEIPYGNTIINISKDSSSEGWFRVDFTDRAGNDLVSGLEMSRMDFDDKEFLQDNIVDTAIAHINLECNKFAGKYPNAEELATKIYSSVKDRIAQQAESMRYGEPVEAESVFEEDYSDILRIFESHDESSTDDDFNIFSGSSSQDSAIYCGDNDGMQDFEEDYYCDI